MENGKKKKIWLSPLISNGMVLQRDSKVKIWGRGVPRKELKLNFLDVEYKTVTNEDGSWSIELKDLKAGGPYTINISHKEWKNCRRCPGGVLGTGRSIKYADTG